MKRAPQTKDKKKVAVKDLSARSGAAVRGGVQPSGTPLTK